MKIIKTFLNNKCNKKILINKLLINQYYRIKAQILILAKMIFGNFLIQLMMKIKYNYQNNWKLVNSDLSLLNWIIIMIYECNKFNL